MSYNKPKILVVMLANTASEHFRNMTNTALDTMFANAGDIEMRCALVETNVNSPAYSQDNVFTIWPNEDFKYNRFMNIGYQAGEYWWPEFFSENQQEVGGWHETRYIVLANNDLIFHENWAEELAGSIDESGMDSGSPLAPGWMFHSEFEDNSMYEGFGIGGTFAGWLQMYRYNSFKKLFPLDEDFEFFCADNSITMEMQKLNLRHALFTNSKVTHLTSSSHSLVPQYKFNHFTNGMCELFHKKISDGKYERN